MPSCGALLAAGSIQLATIGFIGLCGVLQGGRPDNPMWLQVFAGIAALAALAIACVATFLVALVAWPLYGGRQPTGDEPAQLERHGRIAVPGPSMGKEGASLELM